MSILEFLASVNGAAYLVAQNGQFLGLLSNDRCNRDSISNPCGDYGSPCGAYSISNPCCIYGGLSGIYSPYNPACTNPPLIVYQNQVVLLVTKSNYVISSGMPTIDPDILLSLYAQGGYGTVKTMNQMYTRQEERLNQARANTQNSLNNTAATIASLFK
ncbi:MAG: hypothetical protein ACFCUV_15990 [Rivularia sp. (in: cyanobacteria)]